MKLRASAIRLVRFVAMRMMNGHRTDDGIVLDAFINDQGVICPGAETLGYRVTYISDGQRRLDLLRLTSNLEIDEYEHINDAGRILQKQQRWSIHDQNRIEIGGPFVDGGDLEDEPPLEVVEITGIATPDVMQSGPTNIWETQLLDDFRRLGDEDQIAVLRHTAALGTAATLGGTLK